MTHTCEHWQDQFVLSKCKDKNSVPKFHKKGMYSAVKIFILLKYHEKDTFSTIKLSILLKFHKIIGKILIKKVVLPVKGSFTENYQRNLN